MMITLPEDKNAARMSIHGEVANALAGLAEDRVFPVVADDGAVVPYIVFQVVGGNPLEILSGEKPEKKQRRVQVSVWAASILEAAQIAEQVEDSLRAATHLQPEVLTVPIDVVDEATTYRGTMQEFNLYC